MAAQGINQETLQLSQAPHFSIGGSLHFVTNNQVRFKRENPFHGRNKNELLFKVGFTTPGERGRTSTYCTDIAKIIGAPVNYQLHIVRRHQPISLPILTRVEERIRAIIH